MWPEPDAMTLSDVVVAVLVVPLAVRDVGVVGPDGAVVALALAASACTYFQRILF